MDQNCGVFVLFKNFLFLFKVNLQKSKPLPKVFNVLNT